MRVAHGEKPEPARLELQRPYFVRGMCAAFSGSFLGGDNLLDDNTEAVSRTPPLASSARCISVFLWRGHLWRISAAFAFWNVTLTPYKLDGGGG
jgi:hypothetical protein